MNFRVLFIESKVIKLRRHHPRLHSGSQRVKGKRVFANQFSCTLTSFFNVLRPCSHYCIFGKLCFLSLENGKKCFAHTSLFASFLTFQTARYLAVLVFFNPQLTHSFSKPPFSIVLVSNKMRKKGEKSIRFQTKTQ